MDEFLKKIKLIDTLTIDLPISRNDFVNKMDTIVEEGSTRLFSNPFEVFSSSKKDFKGTVNYEGFKIKKRKKLFDRGFNVAIAEGTYTVQNEKLLIETEINGFNTFGIPFYILISIVYAIFLVSFISTMPSEFLSSVLPIFIIHGIIMLLVPYFMMKRSVAQLKHELERELYFLTKK